MKQKRRHSALLRRLEAGLLAAGTLWAAAVTAGSQSAGAAGQALAEAIPFPVLRWELGDPSIPDNLRPLTLLALRQAPQLLAARAQIAQLRREAPPAQPAPAPEASPTPTPPPAPVQETPETAPPGTDNGVPARTLVPRSAEGYAVFGRSYISSTRESRLDTDALAAPFSTALGKEGPQILILHTHGSEAYTPASDPGIVWSGNHRSTDVRCSVVRVGDAMADVFSAAGISVLHDRTLYDYPEYAGSYDRSLAGIQRHLKAHPSIRFILDIHRDAIEDSQGNQYKVVSDIEGQGTAAQLTLVVGSDGSGLPHPGWMENLRLATALQEDLLTQYPTLMRPILLRKSRYNQHAAPGSLLVEVGAAGNSPEEAVLAGQLFAGRMAAVLKAGAS